MNGPQTAKRHTEIGAALRNTEQLGGQLNSTNTTPSPQKQGRPTANQIILILRWVADLIGAAGVR